VTPTTAELLPSGTRILDRQAPLPPPAVPGSGPRILLVIGTALCLAILAILVFGQPAFLESLRQWILLQFERLSLDSWTYGDIVLVGLLSILVGYSVTAIHELGHLIVGLSVGFRCSSMFLGPIQFNAPFRIALNPDPRSWWHGGVTLFPDRQDKLRARAVAMVFAGPAANLLTGGVVLLWPAPKGFLSWLFIVASIGAGVVELCLPLRGPTFIFDGRRIWMLLRRRALAERWLALMRLLADLRQGALPESLSADLLTKATAVRDPSADTVLAHACAYFAAFHQHQDADAGQMLEICLGHASYAPAMREALMSDAAVFQARRRKRPDLAEQWLAEIPVKPQHSWLRSRAEAAVLEGSGDVGGALRKLDEVEAAILSWPDNAYRGASLRLLQRWKAELRGAGVVAAGEG
jgi:hypothetical protein